MLTKHREGSLRELWAISFPLMLTSLSVLAMMFVDRLFIAHLSTDAFSAVIAASTYGWAFLLGAMVLSGISEVFVAQYNGAGQKALMGEPVWQMIWLALGMTLLFLPLSYFGASLFFHHEALAPMQMEYFGWMMLFAPAFPLYGALAGFFIGQGKVVMITCLAFAANFVNAGLDWVMIFGIPEILSPLGIKGAAIATCSSQVFQMIVLFCVFLNKTNREQHGTGNFSLRWKTFCRCIRIGSPAALFIALEIFGWAFYYQLMERASETHIIIAGVIQSLIILLYFFSDGVQKGMTTIVANFIGAEKKDRIPSTISAGIKLHTIFFLVILTTALTFQNSIFEKFLHNTDRLVQINSSTSAFCLITVAFYMLFEGVRYLYAGVLTAAGDTLFLLLSGCVMIWVFLIAPVYFAVTKYEASIETCCFISICYAGFTVLLNFARYRQGVWKSLLITTN